MKLGIDLDADKKIRDLIVSWHPLSRAILMLLALIAVAPLTLFISKLIYNLYYVGNIYLYYAVYYASFGFYYFSFINMRFGGFILLALLLIVKKGESTNILLASPVKYPRIGINNIWLRVPVYLSVIIGFGFMIHGFRILFGMTDSPFAFPTGIFDFLIRTLFAPISEEIYSRFLILYIMASTFGRIPAIFISTLFFTISHDISQPLELSWAASMGLTNALLIIAYGTLWPAIGIHIINNMVVYFSHPF